MEQVESCEELWQSEPLCRTNELLMRDILLGKFYGLAKSSLLLVCLQLGNLSDLRGLALLK